jgi:hypothetical protein
MAGCQWVSSDTGQQCGKPRDGGHDGHEMFCSEHASSSPLDSDELLEVVNLAGDVLVVLKNGLAFPQEPAYRIDANSILRSRDGRSIAIVLGGATPEERQAMINMRL